MVAVAPFPSTNQPCWRPDGSPAGEPFPEHGGSFWTEGKELRQVLIRVKSRDKEVSPAVLKLETPRTNGTAGYSTEYRGDYAETIQRLSLEPGARTLNFQIGVADGDWETVTKLIPYTNAILADGMISKTAWQKMNDWESGVDCIATKDGSLTVSYRYSNKDDWQSRMVVVYPEGMRQRLRGPARGGAGLVQGMALLTANEAKKMVAFELQRRLYCWVGFRNVSLEPGHKTVVEVKDFSGENQFGLKAQNLCFGPVIEQTSEAKQSANQEIARLKLQHAEQEVKDAEMRFSTGLMTEYEVQRAKVSRDIAVAEVKGDNVEAARLKLAIAELDLDVAGKKLSVGKATSQEFEQAKLARDLAAASPSLLAELTELQFLAWQDEWKTNQPGAARHPDSSTVTDAQELGWLRCVQPGSCDARALKLVPEPRFLHLWFSHPLFNRTSLNEVALLDGQNNVISLGANGSMAGGAQDANGQNGNLGWLTHTLSPAVGPNIPPRVTVRLCYTVGPLENTQEVAVTPITRTSMSLEGNSQLNGMGQNVDGKAFVAIAVDAGKMKSRRFGVVAVTKDGRDLTTGGSWSGNADGTGVRVEEFEFAVPLADVAKFVIGTRPIRTREWNDVVLPPN